MGVPGVFFITAQCRILLDRDETTFETFAVARGLLNITPAGMEYFKITSFYNGIPFIPLKDLAVEIITSNKIFQNIHRIWNQDEFLYRADKETQTRMRDAIFDKNIFQQVVSQIWDIFDITGPISQPKNAVKFMKTVAGVTLIHAQLFWFQKTPIESASTFSVNQQNGISGAGRSKILPLTSKQANDVIRGFQKSPQRKTLCALIEGNLSKYGLNMMTAFSAKEVEDIIREAIEVALGWGSS